MATNNSQYQVGQKIRIISLEDSYCAGRYNGREGVIEYIDDIGQLHGTWGGLALIPGVDDFRVID